MSRQLHYPALTSTYDAVIRMMTTDTPAVQCIGLEKTFAGQAVLQDIHLKVPYGTILTLVGPNGAGKTTLIKILASLITPTSGEVRVNGHDITRHPGHAKQMIGYVPSEERSFYWRLTGVQNLEFFAGLYNIRGKRRSVRITEVLTAVGLEHKGDRRFQEYSSGMKQRLAIARGILHDPEILVMDEPTRSLSPDTAQKIRELILDKARHEGKAVLISSHNLQEAEAMADMIAVIQHGRITALGSLDELKRLAGFSSASGVDTLFHYFTTGG